MRRKGELGVRAMHKRYQELHPQGVDKATYVLLIEDFNQRMSALLLDGASIKLPFNLGEWQVMKRKVNFNHLKIDFGHFRKSGGEKVYHLNRHSDGYHAFFQWRKLVCNFTHKSLFKFSPSRKNSRTLATLMKQEGGHKAFPVALSKTILPS